MHPEATHPATPRHPLLCGWWPGVAVLAGCATSAPQPGGRSDRGGTPSGHGRGRDASAHAARAAYARLEEPASPAKDLLRDTLAHADRADANATTLAREMARLSVPTTPKPARHLRLALLLTQTRQPADTARALGLVQRTWPTPTRKTCTPGPVAGSAADAPAAAGGTTGAARPATARCPAPQRPAERAAQAVRAIERSLQTRLSACGRIAFRTCCGRQQPGQRHQTLIPTRHAFLHAPIARPSTASWWWTTMPTCCACSLRLKAAGHEVVAVGSAEAAWPSSTLPAAAGAESDVRLPGKGWPGAV